ncbi:MAG: divalent-cation tolerance protein CutA [Hydrocarboniphaga sp.]|uniref:divalent-cation tolerance protein CutA n=1 Tax=Hydrocarboniphaga sp. TaxID=2033016 RepID=UPI0026252902|nr:divalent-cation tolerance protein CutA [Hydrocarboniphaga sp.]MDB5969796.1 divalent-cation tolerance protein CutA [Hydrocarboniphaga sp.]
MSETALLVYVTCPPASAEAIAVALVEAHVAACVNILPSVRSVYRWKGGVQHDEESLLMIKTVQSRFEALREAVLAQHPDELPEIIAVRWDASHEPYRQWVVDTTRPLA